MGEEAIQRLLGELRRLHERFDELERRLGRLEARLDVPREASASWPAPQPEAPGHRDGRDGAFGPRVRRSGAASHLRAVHRALAMLDEARGDAPVPVSGNGSSGPPGRDAGTIRTLQALQRIRAMQGAGAALGRAEAPPALEPQKPPDRKPAPEPVDLAEALPVELDRPPAPKPRRRRHQKKVTKGRAR